MDTRITFQSQGDTLVGRLLLPPGFSADRRVPGVLVTGAWFTVKEQMPLRYAHEMAERGFAALVFDFRGFGESGGALRQRETPADKITDIQAAAAFLSQRPEVADGRIGALGLCASAGYVTEAACNSPALRAVAVVAPWFQDRAVVDAVYGGTAGVAALRQVGEHARAVLAASGQQPFIPAASLSDERALMFGAQYYTEAHRGLIPAWRNEADPGFWPDWLDFDGLTGAERLHRPFLTVQSEAAALPQAARQFYARVSAAKAELWLDNVSQFDFYDHDAPVSAACDAAAAHFRAYL
ncbi:alpha/beta hydrolase [Roseateles cellulosilyticus]|uniref:Alpha/beta hydrolase n=1 Tax=Pelomonas cellulosilytica TaxID=2906762 RepID=A0ABS8XU33_9BURK|nr:alpha/beta fold hydrolase [Pelomonas sp. P8]MCE4554341.1 alpha/beta hydrolase [Pelomonas sp. P8]